MAKCSCFDPTRRQMVRSMVSGSVLLPAILQQCLADSGDELAPKAPHFTPKAKRVIFLFATGGVSHIETFDPKPALVEAAKEGKTAPNGKPYLGPFWEFSRDSKCGTEVSDLFPWIRKCMDDICVIRSMHGDHNDHAQATLGVHTGSVTFARPSIGSWVSYGLGTENRNLPSFVVLAPALPYAGAQVWSSDFLPGVHSGTLVTPGENPVPNLARRTPTAELQKLEMGLLERFNRKHMAARPGDPKLAARVKSFETAFGMQMEMPDVLDLSKESDATLALYGLERGSTKGFAWQCLVARRLAERGVRFVELIDVGASNNWDAHGDMKTHEPLAKNIDRPIYGLLNDLKSRGMLEDTLVVWTTEFGRSPWPDSPKGRSHHVSVYSSWLAGAGVKGGITYGASDEYGIKVAEDGVHVHDFHATILHLLGFDHTKLTFRHAGRDFRLTDVAGNVVTKILA
jgi:Arylsulfatase A and related enzymes